jgi:hypothetical protein
VDAAQEDTYDHEKAENGRGIDWLESMVCNRSGSGNSATEYDKCVIL